MTHQNIRLFLLAALVLVGGVLYNHWQLEHPQQKKLSTEESQTLHADIPEAAKTQEKDIPEIRENLSKAQTKTELQEEKPADLISVSTDVLNMKIDLLGGDLVYLSLPGYPEKGESQKTGFVLFDRSINRYYVAQSGLTGDQGPDLRGVGRAKYTSEKSSYEMSPNEDRLVVDLHTETPSGVKVLKRFVFLRGQYVIGQEFLIDNESKEDYRANLYAQLKRKPDVNESGGFLGIQTYTGAAVHTEKTPYKKLPFKDIASTPFSAEEENGWAAMVEHYFVSAWIPEPGTKDLYQGRALSDGSFTIGFLSPSILVPKGGQNSVELKLYAGPEITDVLKTLGPGLDLSVDYGILWPICQPLFWLLKLLESWLGNWGWAIVCITILIKLAFYKLSSSSYRSMGNMRKLQPRIASLKERYGDDKQKFSQAVMELYRKEKINPLGGCLPILVQIPVFIALYYVLLGSVELRHAPFILWIQDLSAKDPYYVLPILMGISMFVQQKLSPAPPDPVQAKVMMFMPVIFTILFLNFPSGLVLYWFVNNVLSILQQWYITSQHGERVVAAHGAK